MDNIQQRYIKRIEDNAVWTKLDKEIMIIQTAENQEKVLDLNKTAACLWEKSDGSQTVGDLVDYLCRTYDVDAQAALADVIDFIESMQKKNLLAVSETAM
jgi:hypothetical protein